MNYRNEPDDIIKQNNSRILSGFQIQPRYRFKPTQKTNQEDTDKGDLNEKPKKADQKDTDKNKVSDNTKNFLMSGNLYQYKKTLTEICKLAGFSAGTGSRISQYCVKNGLVKIIQIKLGKGSPKYPVLLQEAYKILGIKEKKFYGKGAGYEHVLCQHIIAEHFLEYKPKIELYRGGKFIDVGIETNKLLVGFEVAMTSAHEKENIEKDFFKAKVDFVIVACINDIVLKEVQKIVLEMPEEIKSKTKVCLISKILKAESEEILSNI